MRALEANVRSKFHENVDYSSYFAEEIKAIEN